MVSLESLLGAAGSDKSAFYRFIQMPVERKRHTREINLWSRRLIKPSPLIATAIPNLHVTMDDLLTREHPPPSIF
jgi:hypothetical protein